MTPSVRPEPDPTDIFRMFIANDGSGMLVPTLQSVLHHLDTAWELRPEVNVAMFHYADYQYDLIEEMERLADRLGFRVYPRTTLRAGT